MRTDWYLFGELVGTAIGKAATAFFRAFFMAAGVIAAIRLFVGGV